MMAAELHIPPYRIGEMTVRQVQQAVAWCVQEQARRAEER